MPRHNPLWPPRPRRRATGGHRRRCSACPPPRCAHAPAGGNAGVRRKWLQAWPRALQRPEPVAMAAADTAAAVPAMADAEKQAVPVRPIQAASAAPSLRPGSGLRRPAPVCRLHAPRAPARSASRPWAVRVVARLLAGQVDHRCSNTALCQTCSRCRTRRRPSAPEAQGRAQGQADGFPSNRTGSAAGTSLSAAAQRGRCGRRSRPVPTLSERIGMRISCGFTDSCSAR